MNTPSLFRLMVGNQVNLFGGPSDGGRYFLESACPKCGTGAKRLDPLRIPEAKVPKQEISITLSFEYLVSNRLCQLIKSQGISCLREVLGVEQGRSLPIQELVPAAFLPPFAGDTAVFECSGACLECGRDGYFNIPHKRLQLVYESLDPAFLRHDLLGTCECFGLSRLRSPFNESVFATPLYLVSPRLADMLRGCENVELEPVEVRGS